MSTDYGVSRLRAETDSTGGSMTEPSREALAAAADAYLASLRSTMWGQSFSATAGHREAAVEFIVDLFLTIQARLVNADQPPSAPHRPTMPGPEVRFVTREEHHDLHRFGPERRPSWDERIN